MKAAALIVTFLAGITPAIAGPPTLQTIAQRVDAIEARLDRLESIRLTAAPVITTPPPVVKSAPVLVEALPVIVESAPIVIEPPRVVETITTYSTPAAVQTCVTDPATGRTVCTARPVALAPKKYTRRRGIFGFGILGRR